MLLLAFESYETNVYQILELCKVGNNLTVAVAEKVATCVVLRRQIRLRGTTNFKCHTKVT